MKLQRSQCPERLTTMPINAHSKSGLRQHLTSPRYRVLSRRAHRLIRVTVISCTIVLASCSNLLGPIKPGALQSEQRSKNIPNVDLTAVQWQKFAPSQPNSNPIRAALVEHDVKIGADRVVVQVPAETQLPPFWLASPGTIAVIQGEFTSTEVDASGHSRSVSLAPGVFISFPANFIHHLAAKKGTQSILYLTVYGTWAPQLPGGAWGQPLLRGAN